MKPKNERVEVDRIHPDLNQRLNHVFMGENSGRQMGIWGSSKAEGRKLRESLLNVFYFFCEFGGEGLSPEREGWQERGERGWGENWRFETYIGNGTECPPESHGGIQPYTNATNVGVRGQQMPSAKKGNAQGGSLTQGRVTGGSDLHMEVAISGQ